MYRCVAAGEPSGVAVGAEFVAGIAGEAHAAIVFSKRPVDYLSRTHWARMHAKMREYGTVTGILCRVPFI